MLAQEVAAGQQCWLGGCPRLVGRPCVCSRGTEQGCARFGKRASKVRCSRGLLLGRAQVQVDSCWGLKGRAQGLEVSSNMQARGPSGVQAQQAAAGRSKLTWVLRSWCVCGGGVGGGKKGRQDTWGRQETAGRPLAGAAVQLEDAGGLALYASFSCDGTLNWDVCPETTAIMGKSSYISALASLTPALERKVWF